MPWDANVDAWLAQAPREVADKTRQLLSQVAEMRKTQVVYPAQENILRALSLASPQQVRVVILGQDPYHEPGQAQGLSFSVPAGCKLPPSLRNIYKELAADLSCPLPQSGDLTSWAAQGVLLMNTTLTVAEHAANSHAKLGWQTLTSYVVRRCFEVPQPVVFLAWGRHAINLVEKACEQAQTAGRAALGAPACGAAAGLGDLAAATALGAPAANAGGAHADPPNLGNKFILASTHPSPLSASRAAGGLPSFLGLRPFSQANDLLMSAGADPIDWTTVCS